MSSVPGEPATSAGDVRLVRSADGTRIAIERVSRGGPALVMVPGATNPRGAWAGVAHRLADSFSCWLMDRRGKGDSTDTQPYALEREYEDVAAVVASVEQPVTLAAHSSGAICALGAALGGLSLGGLVLYEPPWPVRGPNPGVARLDEVEEHIRRGDRDGALELALRVLVGYTSEAVAELRRTPLWHVRSALAHTWPREVRALERLPRAVDVLTAIAVPTLLLRGELTSPALSDATAAIAATIPSATAVELPGQGHAALALAPHLVADAIRSWSA